MLNLVVNEESLRLYKVKYVFYYSIYYNISQVNKMRRLEGFILAQCGEN
jgi:hypothetical protein